MADKPYRPSNGTEGEMFCSEWCDRCTRDEAARRDMAWIEAGCPVRAGTFAFAIDDPDYPKEWVYGPDGQPVCTAFKESDNG